MIFNHTVIEPIQREIMEAFDEMLSTDNALVIEPYKIDIND